MAPFLATIVGAAGLIFALGLSTKGRVAGVWIDTLNRVSLERAQVTLWTLVVLSDYLVLALFNIGFAGFFQSAEALVTYSAFPSMHALVAAAPEISAALAMLSALILPTKDQPDFDVEAGGQDLTKRGAPFFWNSSSGLDERASPALASIRTTSRRPSNLTAKEGPAARGHFRATSEGA